MSSKASSSKASSSKASSSKASSSKARTSKARTSKARPKKTSSSKVSQKLPKRKRGGGGGGGGAGRAANQATQNAAKKKETRAVGAAGVAPSPSPVSVCDSAGALQRPPFPLPGPDAKRARPPLLPPFSPPRFQVAQSPGLTNGIDDWLQTLHAPATCTPKFECSKSLERIAAFNRVKQKIAAVAQQQDARDPFSSQRGAFFEGLERATIATAVPGEDYSSDSCGVRCMLWRRLYETSNLVAYRGHVIRWPLKLPLDFHELFCPVQCGAVNLPAFVAATYIVLRYLHVLAQGRATEVIAAGYQALRLNGFAFAALHTIEDGWLKARLETTIERVGSDTASMIAQPLNQPRVCDAFCALLRRHNVLVYGCKYQVVPFDLWTTATGSAPPSVATASIVTPSKARVLKTTRPLPGVVRVVIEPSTSTSTSASATSASASSPAQLAATAEERAVYRSLHEKLPVLVNRGNRMFRLPRFACYAIERMDQWMSAGMSFGKAMLPGTVEQKLIEKGVHFLNNFGFAFCSIRPAPNVPRAAIERLATYGQTDRPFPRQHSAQRGTSATIAAAAVSGFDTTMSGFPASYSEPTEADLAALLVDDDEHDDDDIFTCGRLEYQKRGGRKSHVFASAVFGCEHLKSTEDDACHLLPVLNPDWLSHAQKIDEEKALQELGRRDSCDL